MRTVEFSTATVELRKALDEAIIARNEKYKAGVSADVLKVHDDACTEACKKFNKGVVTDAMEALLNIVKTDGLPAMFRSYMADYELPKYAVKENDVGMAYVADSTTNGKAYNAHLYLRTLETYCKENSVRITADDKWASKMEILVDNLVRNKRAGTKYTMAPMPSEYVTLRTSWGAPWVTKSGKPATGINDLIAQVNDIIAAIFPAGVRVRMDKDDIRELLSLCEDNVDCNANKAIEHQKATGRTIQRRFIQLVYTRMNNLDIIVRDDYKRDGEKVHPVGAGEKPANGGEVKTVETSANAGETKVDAPSQTAPAETGLPAVKPAQ